MGLWFAIGCAALAGPLVGGPANAAIWSSLNYGLLNRATQVEPVLLRQHIAALQPVPKTNCESPGKMRDSRLNRSFIEFGGCGSEWP